MKKILTIMVALLSLSSVAYANDVIDEKSANQLYYRTELIANQVPYTNSGFVSAIQDGNLALTEMFLKSGYNPNVKYMKLPALFYGISSGEPKVVDLLLEYGADINVSCMDQTALIFAINRKNPEVVDVLIKHNADVDKDAGSLKPLNYALKLKQPQIVQSLINAGATPNDESLIRALKNKDENIKELVLKKYRSID